MLSRGTKLKTDQNRGSATGPALQNQNRGSPTRCPSDGLHMHAPLACGRIWYEREIPLKLLYGVLRSYQLQASSSNRWDYSAGALGPNNLGHSQNVLHQYRAYGSVLHSTTCSSRRRDRCSGQEMGSLLSPQELHLFRSAPVDPFIRSRLKCLPLILNLLVERRVCLRQRL